MEAIKANRKGIYSVTTVESRAARRTRKAVAAAAGIARAAAPMLAVIATRALVRR